MFVTGDNINDERQKLTSKKQCVYSVDDTFGCKCSMQDNIVNLNAV